LRQRYETELCLELNFLSRLIGPKLVGSVAITGSDPYLRAGTDVAVLFETTSPKALKTIIEARHSLTRQADAAVKKASGEAEGVPWSGVVRDDRAISSYVAALKNAVIVSNSRAQLERLISVAKGKTASLATQDDYIYFRNRFRLSETNENAFA